LDSVFDELWLLNCLTVCWTSFNHWLVGQYFWRALTIALLDSAFGELYRLTCRTMCFKLR